MDLEFTGEVWSWRGPAPYHFVTVPDDESADIEASSSLVTALWPKDGAYVVPLKDAVRKAEGIGLGDAVTLRLTVDV